MNKQEYKIDRYTLTDNGLYSEETSKKTNEVYNLKMSEPLFVKKRVQNLDTKDVHLELCYKFNDQYLNLNIGMGQLIPAELNKLLAKGVDIPHEYVKKIATYLRLQQKESPHEYVYDHVGWHKDQKEELVFRHHEVISENNNYQAFNDSRDYMLEPKGDLGSWVNMVREQVVGHMPLEAALAIGFSAPIIGYLSTENNDVDTLITHLAGRSTKGKTTAALLAVSPFGYPSLNKGLMKTWNGTRNSIINMLGGNHGIPLVLDELSASTSPSLTETLYVIASGQEKSRLTKEIQQREQGRWATSLISTGEQSIFDRTNNNIGLTVRTFEFEDVDWTQSADNATEIRKCIDKNYGFAGQAYIKYFFEKGLNHVERLWKDWEDRSIEALPPTDFRPRIAKKYAVIMAGAQMANDALGLGLSLEGILNFFVQHEQGMAERRDTAQVAWDKVKELIIQHQQKFKRNGAAHLAQECWGKIIDHEIEFEIAILRTVLDQKLRDMGFDNPIGIVKTWKEKKWLRHESNRLTMRTQVFDDNESELREKSLNGKLPAKKLDTTFNLVFEKDEFENLLRKARYVNGEPVSGSLITK